MSQKTLIRVLSDHSITYCIDASTGAVLMLECYSQGADVWVPAPDNMADLAAWLGY